MPVNTDISAGCTVKPKVHDTSWSETCWRHVLVGQQTLLFSTTGPSLVRDGQSPHHVTLLVHGVVAVSVV